MAKEFAKDFYASTAWKKTRRAVWARDFGLCVRCGQAGAVVHHKRHLTPRNITDERITLDTQNLETLCEDCHAKEHKGQSATMDGLVFNKLGELVKAESVFDTPPLVNPPTAFCSPHMVEL